MAYKLLEINAQKAAYNQAVRTMNEKAVAFDDAGTDYETKYEDSKTAFSNYEAKRYLY
jgi:hypothetical protein